MASSARLHARSCKCCCGEGDASPLASTLERVAARARARELLAQPSRVDDVLEDVQAATFCPGCRGVGLVHNCRPR